MNITFGPEVLGDFATCSEREWLESNGIGGFASSTLSGAHTRRYHGLLVAAVRPPVARMVLVSKIDETLKYEGHVFQLGCNQHMGHVTPRGYRNLVSFHLAPAPTWRYLCGQVELEKSVLMPHGENTTVVTYTLISAPGPVTLTLAPLFSGRDHGVLLRETSTARLEADARENLLSMLPYGDVPAIHIAHPGGRWQPRARWLRNVEYHLELARGLDFQEDLISPGTLMFELKPGARISLVLSTLERKPEDAAGLVEKELARRDALAAGVEDPLLHWLRRSADQFLVTREDGGESVIAGYHWFCDWGRDTMISLPGLALVLGRHQMAREVIATFSRYELDGLLPNRFPDQGEAPVYNSVDAALWYAYAAEKYVRASGDWGFARDVILPTITRIIAAYESGTKFNIRMDEDGLITQGQVGYALTWMDAKMGDWVVTPRHGKPVEVNALWFNALGFAADLADQVSRGRDADRWRALADKARKGFRQFWNREAGCLYDLLHPSGPDPAIRPNQVFALSLPRTLLEPDQAASVLAVVERELVTPLGLRSLAPSHPGFMARYEGDLARRDGAYHQGAVWSYLFGHYVTAFLNVHGRSPETKARVRRMLVPFRDHLLDAGLGSVSEIFDGDAPHRPAGCISQAWSVAELLRVIQEELDGVAA